METTDRAPARALVLLLAPLALWNIGCPGESEPPPATPLSPDRPDTAEVSLASIEALVPREVPAYSAWEVQRRGGLAIAVTVEKFVRGSCYERQLYLKESGEGAFVREGTQYRGTRSIGQATEQRAPRLLLVQALEKDDLPYGDRIHVARHGLDRPAWSFARVETPEGDHPLDLTSEFSYENDSCTLPPRIAQSQVPPPRGTTVPTQEVISRDRAEFGRARVGEASYVRQIQ